MFAIKITPDKKNLISGFFSETLLIMWFIAGILEKKLKSL